MDEETVTKRQSTFPLFSKYFNTHPQDVVDYFQSMRRQMEDFIEAFRRRIEVEVTYSKSLQQVSKSLDKYIKPGTQLSTSYICSAFKVQHEQRSRQALQLAQSLKTQIETMCSEYLKNQNSTLKKMEKDFKKLYKDAQNYNDNHSRALQGFQSINREMEEMIITKNIMRYTAGIPQQKKVKLIGKASEAIKQNKEYEKLYLNSVRQYNAFVSAYNKEIGAQLDQAETLLREQIVMQGDCLRKLIVAEVSMFKNIEYDLLNISKQMEYLDTQKDVESFTQQQKNNLTNRIIPEENKEEGRRASNSFEASVSPTLDQRRVVGKSMLSQSLFYIEEQYFSWMLANKRNNKLRSLIGKIWKMLTSNLRTQQSAEKQENQQNILAIQSNAEQIKSQAKVEQQTKRTQESSADQQQQAPQSNEQQTSWDQQLRQTIAQFKIIQPPSFLTPNEKKDKRSNLEKIYQSFLQITNIIALLWNSEQIDPQIVSAKLTNLQGYMAQHHLYRLIALIFIEEYRLQHQVVIKSPANARVCGRIIRTVLRESQTKNDVFIIRGLLALVFTFYWVDEKAKKLIYQIPQICQCQIWKKTDFWEAAIFETTFEQMAFFTIQKGETQAETVLRQKNIIFSQLASYCHYMVMNSITSKNVRLTVGRYCRLYDMTEEQNKDLSKMINNTTKQFKEMSGKVEKEKSVIGD